MRVLHIVRTFDLSGRSRMIHQLAEGLERHGIQSTVAVLSGSVGYAPAGLDIVPLGRREGLDFLLAARLAALAGRRDAAILHSHGRGAVLCAALAAGRRSLVHTVHRADGDPLPGGALARGWLRARIGLAAAVSDAARAAFEQANAFPRAKTMTIHNGINPQQFSGAPRSSAGDPIIGAVANLSPDKDIATLLQAFRLIMPRQPRAGLRIIGDGPARESARTLSGALGIAEHVQFMGFRNDVPEQLSQFTVFVHSTRTEGLGIAILEAMAAGVPVVASRVGGIPEIVEDGVTGLLVPPGDDRALARAVADLLGDAPRAAELARRAKAQVIERFTVQRMCEAYAALYRRVLSP